VTYEGTRAGYDRVAERYEQRFEDELDGKPADRERLAAFAEATSGLVLEVGAGPGHVGAFVAARASDVVALDLSPEMARLALARVPAVCGDMLHLPVRSASLGGALAFYSIIHLAREAVPDALGELHRVLGSGGRLLVAVHRGTTVLDVDAFLDTPETPMRFTLFEPDELADLLVSAGFEVAELVERESYPTESGTRRIYALAVKP
jgi:SAM-dependent methyltransferase